MDAKQRPSHSRMYDANGNYVGSGLPPPRPPAHAAGASQAPPLDSYSHSAYALLLGSRALQAACLVYCVTEYGADITLCEGPSMHPTIRSQGEIILVCKHVPAIQGGTAGRDRERAARAAQAAFAAASGRADEWHQPLVSVSDLPPPSLWRGLRDAVWSPLAVGDVVVVRHPLRKGNVCKRVLGLPGDQVLLPGGALRVVPDGHLWLEGDNPNNSSDSRAYGAVPAALLVGRVVLRLWPLRGDAWMRRGAPPRGPRERPPFTGSTVLPAGYEGQRIVRQCAADDRVGTN